MKQLFFISAIKVTQALEEFVIPQQFIKIGDLTYVQLSRKPKGRSIERTLTGVTDPETQLIIYK